MKKTERALNRTTVLSFTLGARLSKLLRTLDVPRAFDAKATSNPTLSGKEPFKKALQEAYEKNLPISAMTLIRAFTKDHVRPYVRRLSLHAGDPILNWCEKSAKELWKRRGC